MKLQSRIENIKKRITCESGETIVETMVSVLITSLALLLLATAIGSSIRIIRQSKTSMEARYTEESSMVERSESVTDGSTGSYSADVPLSVSGDSALDIYETSDGAILYKRGD